MSSAYELIYRSICTVTQIVCDHCDDSFICDSAVIDENKKSGCVCIPANPILPQKILFEHDAERNKRKSDQSTGMDSN